MREARPRNRSIWGWLGGASLMAIAFTAAMGFTYYRSVVGPSTAFRLNHDADADIQSVTVNGRRGSGVSMPDHHLVVIDVRPNDPVNVHVLMCDGREFSTSFPEMGRNTRVITLDDTNLVPGNGGQLNFTFDREQISILRFRYERGRSIVNQESPILRTLPPGDHPVEIEYEHVGGPKGGQILKKSRIVKINSGETLDLSFEEFLKLDEPTP